MGTILFTVLLVLHFHFHDPLPWWVWVIGAVAMISPDRLKVAIKGGE